MLLTSCVMKVSRSTVNVSHKQPRHRSGLLFHGVGCERAGGAISSMLFVELNLISYLVKWYSNSTNKTIMDLVVKKNRDQINVPLPRQDYLGTKFHWSNFNIRRFDHWSLLQRHFYFLLSTNTKFKTQIIKNQDENEMINNQLSKSNFP